MPPQISVTTKVQIAFTVSDPDRKDGLSYNDALYYETGQVPSNAVVRQAGLARYQAWRAALDAPHPRPPRAERLKALKEARDAAVAQAASAEAELTAELNSQET